MNLREQVALVTGGGRGLGRAYALALASAGAAVAVTARTAAEIQETVQIIEQNGGRALAVTADVTDVNAAIQMVATVEQTLGPVDLLVNNAGVLRAVGRISEVAADEWWREVAINLRGPFLYSQAVLPSMIRRKRGRIINLASGAGLEPIDGGSAYCVSKTALIRLSESLALETKEHGIAVFAIHPGTVRTPMTKYMHDSEVVGQRVPAVQQWFRQIYAENQDIPIERSVALVLQLAAGKADLLSGCYLDVNADLADLINRAAEIQQTDLYTLRLRTGA